MTKTHLILCFNTIYIFTYTFIYLYISSIYMSNEFKIFFILNLNSLNNIIEIRKAFMKIKRKKHILNCI